ncbi:MAG: glycosyltransferase [Candidatus Planktophila sp.]|jgi:cellulose synthase/poly-beta-1,6-N-acetylglucosamine synthase-like glycosyltransferase|nr:glycosyltransferase [Candidatus Planktophila sp.]
MSALLSLSVVINAFLLSMAIFNSITIIRPRRQSSQDLSFSLLVPCRNEADNAAELVASLGALDHLNFEVIFIDDNSTDGTGDLLRQATASRPSMKVINAEQLPDGWMGKPWALSQGLIHATHEYIVTIDADVRLAPHALSAMDALLQKTGSDFLSPYPCQEAVTLSERLIQPLLQWTWMTTVPLRLAMQSSRKSLAVANGQFLLMRKSALISSGGFATIKSSVLDDIDLARALIHGGFRGGVCDGSTIASTRMYSSFKEIRAGYGKSMSTGFGGIFGSIALALVMAVSAILPFIASIAGSTIATASLLMVIASRIISAISSRSLLIDALLHPISALLFIYLLIYSNLFHSRITWKGRPV